MTAYEDERSFMAPVDYVANPAFSFPAQPMQPPSHGPRRTASLHLNPSTPQRIGHLERKSASTLPAFSFNVSDTSGRAEGTPSSCHYSAAEAPASAGRALGHRRRASEFVGGSSRFGTPAALVSTSPLKAPSESYNFPDPAASGSPVRNRGHAHRRSSAVSAHDLQTILQPRGSNVSMSQPEAHTTTFPDHTGSEDPITSPNSLSSPEQTPQPRPRVGFSKNIEFIPRPLSTISSEAESIISIHGGQSSASPLRHPSFSSPSRRKSRSSRSSLSEVEAVTPPRLSCESPRSPDREDADDQMVRATSKTPVSMKRGPNYRDFSFPPTKAMSNLDRRSSEPTLSVASLQRPRRSSVSLREPVQATKSKSSIGDLKAARITRKSSANKVKAWASAMIGRKKSVKRAAAQEDAEPCTPMSEATPASEADLEELFNQDPFGQADGPAQESQSMKLDFSGLRDFQPTFDTTLGTDTVIDLDAALGPNKTPSRDGRSPGFGARRQLHSSRASRDLNSPGNSFHRRAESAPVLTPFDYPKSPSPCHSPMADVFEEEEDDMMESTSDKGSAKAPAFSFPQGPVEEESAFDDGLGIQEHTVAPTTPTGTSIHSEVPIIEDTIMEEMGPIDIVQDHEMPRFSTVTKSSDSSDTPTVLAESVISLAPPNAPFMATPSTYAGSTFSTPEMHRGRDSFDGPRLGTSASSVTDCRTLSSVASERPDTRPSVDDVPSLTSSRSTMISSKYASHRDITERASSPRMRPQITPEQQLERRRKRTSIQSLTKLMAGPFGESRNKLNLEQDNVSAPNLLSPSVKGGKKEHRLSKLMFWKSKRV